VGTSSEPIAGARALSQDGAITGRTIRLIDIVFPTATNHHGTLFGGVALAHMDKVAFIAATRHGRVPFVTASCERIDFAAPARQGELIEIEARVVRVGRRSLTVEVTLNAEAPLSGDRRVCTKGTFNMVAPRTANPQQDNLPPLSHQTAPSHEPLCTDEEPLRMVEMVFPDRINHYGTLFGGEALAMMGKASFVAATRHTRKNVMMAASHRVEFAAPVPAGELIELTPTITLSTKQSTTVMIDLWSESLLTGQRRHAARGEFVMATL
jgi:acyl-CoA hydrolase